MLQYQNPVPCTQTPQIWFGRARMTGMGYSCRSSSFDMGSHRANKRLPKSKASEIPNTSHVREVFRCAGSASWSGLVSLSQSGLV
jgi:hypothetical protein